MWKIWTPKRVRARGNLLSSSSRQVCKNNQGLKYSEPNMIKNNKKQRYENRRPKKNKNDKIWTNFP